jgi:hypothetical protein
MCYLLVFRLASLHEEERLVSHLQLGMCFLHLMPSGLDVSSVFTKVKLHSFSYLPQAVGVL